MNVSYTAVRDWSGWICTVGAVMFNYRQRKKLQAAKTEIAKAREELHDQRVLQAVSMISASITRLSYSVDDGRRASVRQECQHVAGDISHLSTYGKDKVKKLDSQAFQTLSDEVGTLLQIVQGSEGDYLRDEEKMQMRRFCHSANIATRSFQGSLEAAFDLRNTSIGSEKNYDAK